MITVKVVEDERGCFRMTIRGHSGSAPYGHDLICAGVTALAYAAAQSVKSLYESGKIKDTPMVYLTPGEAEICATPVGVHHTEVWTALWTVQCGFRVLAESYPKYINVQEFLHDQN